MKPPACSNVVTLHTSCKVYAGPHETLKMKKCLTLLRAASSACFLASSSSSDSGSFFGSASSTGSSFSAFSSSSSFLTMLGLQMTKKNCVSKGGLGWFNFSTGHFNLNSSFFRFYHWANGTLRCNSQILVRHSAYVVPAQTFLSVINTDMVYVVTGQADNTNTFNVTEQLPLM